MTTGVACGGLAGGRFLVSRRIVGATYQLIAGLLVGTVGFEIAPRVLHASQRVLIVVALLAGALVFAFLRREVLPDAQPGNERAERAAGAFLDMAVLGAVVGSGVSVEYKLGLLLALTLLPGAMLESYGAVAALRARGLGRGHRILFVLGLMAVMFSGSVVAPLALRAHDPSAQLGSVAFTTGMFISVVAERLPPSGRLRPLSIVVLVVGIALVGTFTFYMG